MRIGKLRHWVADRGFGFLHEGNQPHNGTFVHISNFERGGIHDPQLNHWYAYEIAPNKFNPEKSEAVDLRRATDDEVERELPYTQAKPVRMGDEYRAKESNDSWGDDSKF